MTNHLDIAELALVGLRHAKPYLPLVEQAERAIRDARTERAVLLEQTERIVATADRAVARAESALRRPSVLFDAQLLRMHNGRWLARFADIEVFGSSPWDAMDRFDKAFMGDA